MRENFIKRMSILTVSAAPLSSLIIPHELCGLQSNTCADLKILLSYHVLFFSSKKKGRLLSESGPCVCFSWLFVWFGKLSCCNHIKCFGNKTGTMHKRNCFVFNQHVGIDRALWIHSNKIDHKLDLTCILTTKQNLPCV